MSAQDQQHVTSVVNKVTPKVSATIRKEIPSMIKPHVDRMANRILSKVGQTTISEVEEQGINDGLRFVNQLAVGLDDPTAIVVCPREKSELLAVQRETAEVQVLAVYPLEDDTLTPKTTGTGAVQYQLGADPRSVFAYTKNSQSDVPFQFSGTMTAVPQGISVGAGDAWALTGLLYDPEFKSCYAPVGRVPSGNGNYTPFYCGNSNASWGSDPFIFQLTALDPGNVGQISISIWRYNGGAPAAMHTPQTGITNGELISPASTSTSLVDGFAIIIQSTQGVDLTGVRFKFSLSRGAGVNFTPTVCPQNMHNHHSNLLGDHTANRVNVEAAVFVMSCNPNANLKGGFGLHSVSQAYPAHANLSSTDLYQSIGETPMKKKKFNTDVGTSGFVLSRERELKAATSSRDESVRQGSFVQMDKDTSYGTGRFSVQLAYWTTYHTSSTKVLKVQSPGDGAMWAYNNLNEGDSIWENPDHKKALNGLRRKAREAVEGAGAPQLNAKELAKQKIFTKKNAERLMNGALDLAEIVL